MTPDRKPVPSGPVAHYIREHVGEITADWEKAVLGDLKELTRLDRGALLDHLPEVLNGLADWVDGRTREAEAAFAALADGHALQRLGFGIDLATVNIEYSRLRQVILGHLLALPLNRDIRNQFFALNDGLDRAIQLAVRRYMEHRDYLRDRFISILGHDLKNPLTAVNTSAENLLRSKDLDESQRKQLEVITKAGDRMNRMIGDVLDFARGHLGQGIPATPAECDMGEICRSAVEEAQGANPGRKIELITDGNLKGTFDRDRVLQAIGNLITNAVQYGEDPITVAASEAEDRRSLLTRVTNRGRAIPKPLIARIFNPFVRQGDAEKGTLGLGLFITSQINRAHGGTYEVTSKEGETSFLLRWPRVPRALIPDRP